MPMLFWLPLIILDGMIKLTFGPPAELPRPAAAKPQRRLPER